MHPADPSLSAAERVDAVCDRFESEWKAGGRPRIEDYLRAAPESDRAELRPALLALELELQGRGAADTSVTRSSVRTEDKYATAEHIEGSQGPPRVGRFEIRGVLGSGAFGKVYRALDPQLGREVALKVPVESAVKTDAERVQFLKEARAAATINHPNVCQIHEVGEHAGRPYIVMALVPGQSLADMLKARKEPLPQKQAALIVRKVAMALAAAHNKGIVHRDLKPANVMFDRDRKDVIVMDFGLARGPRPADARATQSGMVMGTPAYMSPEQARGDSKDVGPAGDIFSLGVILYELLAGVRPFAGTATEVLGQILHVEPEPPSKRRAGIDPRLEAACVKAMAKDPAKRFATMKEFAAAIDDYLRPPVAAALAAETAKADRTRQSSEASGTETLAGVFAAMSADRKRTRAETAAAVEAAIAKHHTPRWIFVVGGLVIVAITIVGLTALGGIIFFTRSDKVRVTVELTDVDLSDRTLSFFLDEEPITAEALANPIELKPGDHVLVVKRGATVVRRMLLTVAGGRSPGIRVRDITPPPESNPPAEPPPVISNPVDRKKVVWTPLLRSADELIPGETARTKRPEDVVRFANGVLELKGPVATFQPKFTGRNYVVRAKVVQIEGFNVMFNVRRKPGFGGYGAWFHNHPAPGWPPYGLGKGKAGQYTDLASVANRVTNRFPVEYAVAAYGEEISVYVNGKRVLAHLDSDSPEGGINFATTKDGHAFLRDLEVCVLDNTDLTPADVFKQSVTAPAPVAAADGFVSLFNGKDLTGWEGLPAAWWIYQGDVYGKLPANRNKHTFLCTTKEYGDFELKFQVKLKNGKGNSGVQIRSKIIEPAEYIVAGPQVEIDAKLGGLYGERTTGAWMQRVPESVVERVFKPNDFNAYLVRVVGKHVTVTVNGEQLVDGDFPTMADKGIIALQLHGGGAKAEMKSDELVFKDVMLRDLSKPAAKAADGFVPLFNGKDLSGWRSVGEPKWSWADGRLLGSPAPGGAPGFLVTEAQYEDFELELQYRLAAAAGSGLFLRTDANGPASGKGQLEVQIIDDDAYNPLPINGTGSVWNVFPRRVTPPIKRGDWNNLRVRLAKRHIEVWLNGTQTIDANLDAAGDKLATVPGLTRKSGGIGLQQNQKADVEFRDLRIRDLAPAAEQGFASLFNGKDLTGWKTHPEDKAKWEVRDGAIVGSGPRGHLFSDRGDYENFRFRIEAKINDKGNSGQYFRAQLAKDFPLGYEAQINATHKDTIRSGSLYPNARDDYSPAEKKQMVVLDQLIQPNEWFTQEVIAVGNHIVIKLNGKTTVDFVDTKNRHTSGHFAIQQHDPGTIITVRKVEVLELGKPAANGDGFGR